ncbi:substance-P receptor-like [Mercenaria mercenaria]|uniref:substance-P receptor-like n=1 Tax=Mercenaria mercenaria TaxID=6596 RepID=UPI001E1D8ED6|nr:substance-P receptor-like [Mercenaria mercenaria]
MERRNITFNYLELLEQIERQIKNYSINDTSSDDTAIFHVPIAIVVVLAILYGSISIIAIIGNGLVILVIAKDKRMQTVTNIFIGNLAVADVIIGLFTTPFQFQPALLQRWDFPDFLCSIAPSFKILSVSVSVFTLTIISLDRYVAVIYPLKAGFSKSLAFICLALIWILSIGSSFPEGYFHSVRPVYDMDTYESKPFCLPQWPTEDFGKYYHLYLVSVQYFFPLLVINFSYTRIACRIWGTKVPGNAIDRDNVRQRTRQKVVKMLIIVVLLFAFCWMPFQLYGIISEFQPDINGYKYINVIWFCFNWLAMSNSCYNPFIYGLLNEKFKREYRLLLSKLYCVRKCTTSDTWLAGNENSDEPNETKRITLTFRAGQSFRQVSAGSKIRNGNGKGKLKYTAIPANCHGRCEDTDQTSC